MIFNNEETISKGTEYKFKCMPIDPNDPFRGKYITLSYEVENTEYDQTIGEEYFSDQVLYGTVDVGPDGFAIITHLYTSESDISEDYIAVRIVYVAQDHLKIDVPLDRFYMEEALAQPAEKLVQSQRRDTSIQVYALVSLLRGNPVLTDVYVDGDPIAEYVRLNQDSKN